MSDSDNKVKILDKAEHAVVYLYRLFHRATNPRPKPPVERAKSVVPPTPPTVEPVPNEQNTSDLNQRHERRRGEIKRKREKNIREHRANLRALREERADLDVYGHEIDRLLHDQEESLKAETHDLNNLDRKD